MLKLRMLGSDTIAVAGDVDEVNWSDLAAALSVPTVRCVDMSMVTFFSSCGIRALLTAHRQRLADGGFVIVDASAIVRRVLQLTDLTALFAGPTFPVGPASGAP